MIAIVQVILGVELGSSSSKSIPASNADSERVFSLARRIKTDYLHLSPHRR